MSSKGGLDYSRQDLRKSTKFVEGEYTGINPRQFYRSLKRSLEEIQEGNDFKYETTGTQTDDLSIESEEVGEKTGRVRGRLSAESDWRVIGQGQLDYKPYGPHGALGMVVGGLLFLVGLTGEVIIAIFGLILLLGGGYLYFQTETGAFDIKRQDEIRALMTGEVSERTIDEGDETRTDIFANMSVIYAGDTLLLVPVDQLEDMTWTLRWTLANQVTHWYNRTVEKEEDRVEVQDGFLGHLTAFSDRSAQSARDTIVRYQNRIATDFEMGVAYTGILEDTLPPGVRDELSAHQDALLDELEDLSQEMEVYVEREGLERVG